MSYQDVLVADEGLESVVPDFIEQDNKLEALPLERWSHDSIYSRPKSISDTSVSPLTSGSPVDYNYYNLIDSTGLSEINTPDHFSYYRDDNDGESYRLISHSDGFKSSDTRFEVVQAPSATYSDSYAVIGDEIPLPLTEQMGKDEAEEDSDAFVENDGLGGSSDEDYQPRGRRRVSAKRRLQILPSKSRLSHTVSKISSPANNTEMSESHRRFSCNSCPDRIFKDESGLQKHIKQQHTRPFVCVFNFAGCDSTFASKNEWKRHVTSQHLLLNYWLCQEDACSKLPNSVPSLDPHASLPNGAIFNRKDLYTQHYRRMHIPQPIKKQVKEKKTIPEWEDCVRSRQEKAHRLRCHLPDYMRCPAIGCVAEFSGPNSWDERMEHVSKHLEKAAQGLEPSILFGGENDPTLTTWAFLNGVIKQREDTTGMWCLHNPLWPKRAENVEIEPGVESSESQSLSTPSTATESATKLRKSERCSPTDIIDSPEQDTNITASSTAQPSSPSTTETPANCREDESSESKERNHQKNKKALERFMIWFNSRLQAKVSLILAQADQSNGSSQQQASEQSGHTRGTMSNGGSSQQNSNNNRKRKDRQGDDSGDGANGEGDGDGDDEDRLGHPSKRSKTGHREQRFACPFFKHDARWEHIYRRHKAPDHRCNRCQSVFDSNQSLCDHERNEEACTLRDVATRDEVNKDTLKKLKSRARVSDASEEARWRTMYQTIFPEDIIVPSPYYERTDTQHHDLQDFCRHISQTLPGRLYGELDSLLGTDRPANLRNRLPNIVQSLVRQLYRDFQSPNNSTNMPTTISEPTDVELVSGPVRTTNEQQSFLVQAVENEPNDQDPMLSSLQPPFLLDFDFPMESLTDVTWDLDPTVPGYDVPLAEKWSDSGYGSWLGSGSTDQSSSKPWS
ncbi:hypothetical protein JX266_011826 [Neoarthrinium moseri]|nr:hypothetical protein JX266_011826 [Neoarthrinium moseri]